MSDVLAALEEVRKRAAELSSIASVGHAKNLAVADAQPLATAVAKQYFESVREELELVQRRVTLSDEVDKLIQKLLSLAAKPSPKEVYRNTLDELDTRFLEALVDLMKARGTTLVLSPTERSILKTLEGMLPPSAASYQQALRDLSQSGGRVSWRGTGTELREVLRDVMDHLAPDDKVMATTGFTLEANQKGPTQRQKVRYILKARKSPSAAINVAEGSLNTVEESVAALARSTYQRGSVSTHTKTGDTEVRNLKRYVDALLAELLEVK